MLTITGRSGQSQKCELIVHIRKIINVKNMFSIICQRLLGVQLRRGILPPHTERGRYGDVPEDERIFGYCDLNEVENEIYFSLCCPSYNDLRKILLKKLLLPV